MKVLFVCSASFRDDKTGDATQGRETASALAQAGVEVIRLYEKDRPLRIYDVDGVELNREETARLVDAVDVVHLLPASPYRCEFWCSFCAKPICGSSIFWAGWERVAVALMSPRDFLKRSMAALREIRNMIPACQDFRGIDVFLPNSDAEGRCLMKCFRKKPDATYMAVPNGFVAPPFDVWGLERSHLVPDGDYMVVPGVFAPRKNQIGLIRALKRCRSTRPVVFLGGALDGAYYEKCRAMASESMVFTGFLPSSGEEYWKILRHARVACLTSDCETPGIAMIEAAYAGARPVVTKFGGTKEYYGDDGEYLNPCFRTSIVEAVDRGWSRGRLERIEAESYRRFSWQRVAEKTVEAYRLAIERKRR